MTKREEIIRDYVELGMSGAEVAEKHGRSVNGLRVCLHRWGVKLDGDQRSARVARAHRDRACVNSQF